VSLRARHHDDGPPVIAPGCALPREIRSPSHIGGARRR
jgi:hypothetical protein